MTHLSVTGSPTRTSSSAPLSPATERETQDRCPECEQYVPELIYDICLNCLDDHDPEAL